jgi:hypothetical protein
VKNSLTVGDLAAICEVGTHTVQQWCDDGQLDGVYRVVVRGKGLGHRRIPVGSLRSFMRRIGMPLKWLDDYLRAKNRMPRPAASSNGVHP